MAPAPAPAPVPPPAPVIEAAPPVAETPSPVTMTVKHIALLLPVQAPDFRPAAEAFQAGFQASQMVHGGGLPIRLYGTDGSADTISKSYVHAVESGARVVVGPMTRNGVTALASSPLVMVPTLALNQPEGEVRTNNLYFFGLSVEAEAAMVARQAYDDGFRKLAVASTPTAFARRTREAFVQAWRALGGTVIATAEMRADPGALPALRELGSTNAEFIFLAASFEETRVLRPYLPSQLPVYTTSQVNLRAGEPQHDLDLEGVRFLDMLWLLAPNDPRVSIYPAATGLSSEMSRFYALGIDSYRIATALAEGQSTFAFEGVTGRIDVTPGRVVERAPWRATFRNGLPVLAQ